MVGPGRTLALICLAAFSMAAGAEIVVEVDRTEVAENESFAVTYIVDGASDSPPDFSPLARDFEILQRNQQSSTQIINGRIQTERRWVLTLMPRAIGEYVLPPVRIGNDVSAGLEIRVVAARASAPGSSEIFLETEASNPSPWVQSEVLYRVRLYVAADVDTRNATLSEPVFQGMEVLVEKVGDDRQFQITLQGRRYLVVERVYAVFPQQSGSLEISPARLEVQVISRSQRFPRLQRFSSEGLTLDVQPIPPPPQGGRVTAWLPASRLVLEEQWSSPPETMKAGEPVTRTVTIVADGLLASQLPELPEQQAGALRFYPDQPELTDRVTPDGFSGRRTERSAIIAPAGGRFVLDPLEIVWWNTTTAAWETARLAGREFEVAAALVEAAPPADEPSAQTDDPDAAPVAAVPWLTWITGIGWLLTAAAWFLSRRGSADSRDRRRGGLRGGDTSRHGSVRRLRKAAIAACRHGSPDTARAALIEWAAVEWPDRRIDTVGALAAMTGSELGGAIRELEAALYRSSSERWDGALLADALKRWGRTPVRSTEADASALATLNP